MNKILIINNNIIVKIKIKNNKNQKIKKLKKNKKIKIIEKINKIIIV